MKSFKKSFLLFLGLNISVIINVYPHGLDKPGPNGGYIQMPGSFHTELVPNKDNAAKQFKVFLLDIAFKNPTTQNSSITVSLKLKNDSLINISCEIKNKESYFLCTLPADKSLDNSKEIVIKPIRNGVNATNAIYKLPLIFKTSH